MKEYDKIPAQAVVEVTTSWGRTCLREIGRDLKEGTVLNGYYYPVSKAFDFEWKGEGAMLWIGDNGRLVSLGEGQRHKYDAWSYAIRLRVLPSQPIRAAPLFPEHRQTLQGNAPVLAVVEYQAGVVIL